MRGASERFATRAELTTRANSGAAATTFAVSLATMIFTYPILNRSLGSSQFGIYIISTALVAAVVSFDFGLAAAATKVVAESVVREELRRSADSLATALAFYVGMACLATVAMWLAAPALQNVLVPPDLQSPEVVLVLRLASLQIGPLALVAVVGGALKALGRFDAAAVPTIANIVLTNLGACVTAGLLGLGLVGAAWASAVGTFAAGATACLLLFQIGSRKGIDWLGGRPSGSILAAMLGFGGVLLLMSLGTVLLMRVQVLVVGHVLGPFAVVAFQAALSLTSRSHDFAGAISEVLFSSTVAQLARGPRIESVESVRRMYLSYVRFAIMIAVLALTAVILAGAPLLKLWLGASVGAVAAESAVYLMAGFALLTISAPSYFVLNALGYHRQNLVFGLANGLLTVFLTLALPSLVTPSVAAFGAAFMVSNLVVFVLYQLFTEKVVWRRIRRGLRE